MKSKFLTVGVLVPALSVVLAGANEVPAYAAKAEQSVQLRFMMYNLGAIPNANLVKYLIVPFEKSHPGVTIKVNFVNGNQIDTKVILDVNAGDPPNLFPVSEDTGMLANKGVLMPLTDLYQKSHISSKIFIPAAWGQIVYNGVPYGIPVTSNPALALWYNPEAMKAAGLNPSNPPRTWSELMADSLKAVKFDKHGNLVRVGLEFNDQIFGSVASMEGNFTGGDHFWSHTGNKLTPDPVNQYNINFLNYIKKLADTYGGYAKYSRWMASDQGWDGPIDYLAQGKALFTIDGFWDYLGFDQYAPKFRYAATYAPTQHGLLSEQVDNPTLSWGLGIPKGQTPQQIQADWEFMVYAGVTHSYLLAPTTNGSTVLSQQGLWDQTVAQTLPPDHKWFAPEFKYFTDPVKYITQAPPNLPIWNYYSNELTTAADAVLYNKKTPLQALKQVQQDVQTQSLIGGQ